MKMFINNCIDLIWSLIIHLLLFDKIWGFWHSHSGNFCHCIELKHRITIDSDSIKKRKNVWLGAIEFTEYNLALFEIHAFSGNDYISSFFKRGKEKMLEDYWKIFTIFNLLRNSSQEWHGDPFDQLEKFVCFVYGGNIRNISNLRSIKISAREEIWSKASERIQSSTFGFFTSLQAFPSASCQADQLDCIQHMTYVKKLETANYCNTRNKRPLMAS